jgi:hypothetical protein
VTALNPAAGKATGGTSVTVTGTGFLTATAVSFGGTAGTSLSVVSDTSLTIVSPAHAVGQVDVLVTNTTGTSGVVAADKFTFDTTPTVTALNPAAGKAAGGTSVTVTGTGFLTATGVSFGGTAGTSLVVVSDTSLTIVSPAHAIGVVDVLVTNSTGTSTNVVADNFTYDTTPTVTAVSPTFGTTAGGTTVTVTGTGFLTATGVTFGGTAGTSLSVVSDTSLTIRSPGHAAGQVDVLVTNTTGTSTNVVADNFTYVAPPTVTALSPAYGTTAGGTTVTVTGTGFTGASVTFAGAAVTPTVISDTSMTVVSPAHALGAFDLLVTNLLGTSAAVAADKFTYVVPPSVTAISPTYGTTAGGTTLTVTGTGFTAASVFIAGIGVTPSGVTDTSLTVVSPAHAIGVVDVLVANLLGASAAVAADKFTYIAPPSVSAISTYWGSTAGGTTVTLTGTGFTNASVTIAGAAVTPSGVTDTSMTIVSPAHAIGLFDILVTNLLGTSASTPYDMFWYVAPATVTAISPNYGTTLGGTSVTVTGTGFTNASVTIGGTAVTPTILSDTSMTVVSPAHAAGVSDVLVTMLLGTSPNGAADNFTYVGPPAVTAVSPASGTTAGGTTVTVTGTAFTGATGVSFGGTAGTSLAVGSDTSLTIVTPAHAVGAVDVTVTTAFGTSTAVAGDVYTYAVPTFQAQGGKLTPSGGIGTGLFGMAVALSADGNTALIGAPTDNGSLGAAYVLTRSGSTWTQQAKLTAAGASEAGAGQFGMSVALSDDGNTALIGGPADATNSGAVWVFVRSGSTWAWQVKLGGGSGQAGPTARFGGSVALSADGNTALIGAPYDNNVTQYGAAWVFTRSGVTWTQQSSKLVSSFVGNGFRSGFSVALSADGNTALLGCDPLASGGQGDAFRRSGSIWTYEATLVDNTYTGGAGLVALSADGNTALEGPWVFTRSGTTWTQGQKLVASDRIGSGGSLGKGADLSADGTMALVGDPADNTNVGAAWVFTRSGSTWTQLGSKLTGASEIGAGQFGGSASGPVYGNGVALSGDKTTALVGGHLDNTSIGAVWAFIFG